MGFIVLKPEKSYVCNPEINNLTRLENSDRNFKLERKEAS